MKKLMLGCGVLRSICAVGMMAFAVTAEAETVTYLDYDASSGTFTNATAECTVITRETTAFADGGWYVAKGTNSCLTITVSGAAHLVLADGAELTVESGIRVSVGNSLSIYGQDANSGKLIAKNYTGCPAIGGGSDGESCGAITVNGGIVEAIGGNGIGGATGAYAIDGMNGGDGGDGGALTVNGGAVTASKIGGGAGGSGNPRSGGKDGLQGSGTMVTFMGGVTEAQNGIFTKGDPILATYMTVEGVFNEVSYIKVEEQERPKERDVAFILGEGVIGITTDFAGDCLSDGNRITLKDVDIGARIRIEVNCALGFEYKGATEFVVSAAESLYVLNATQIEVLESVEYVVPGESALSVVRNVSSVFPESNTFTNGGWYVATGRRSCGVIEVKGAANLILADGAELTVNGGIRVTAGNSLTIYGQCEGSGKLIATGAEGCAGIGGGHGNRGSDSCRHIDNDGGAGGSGGACGIVTINGGRVSAEGGAGAAGVGGGMGGVGGDGGIAVDIKEVELRLKESHVSAGGVGGIGGTGGCVTINGGTVTAIGGADAAGIGGGAGGRGGVGGSTLQEDGNGGGGGVGGAGGSLKITGGTVTVSWLGGGAGGNGGPCLGRSAIPGEAGAKGSGGAGATVTFLGGVTEAQKGIFTEGDPTLGEDVEVTGNSMWRKGYWCLMRPRSSLVARTIRGRRATV